MLTTSVNPQAKQPALDENRLDTLSEEALAARVASADAYVAREQEKLRVAQEKDAADREAFAQEEKDWAAAQTKWAAAQEKFRSGAKPMNNAAAFLVSARQQRAVLSEEQTRREKQRRISQGLDRE